MRDLEEGSYFSFTALASPHLVSWSPEFPTEGLAPLKSEQDPPLGMPTKDWSGRKHNCQLYCCFYSNTESKELHDEVSGPVLVVKY